MAYATNSDLIQYVPTIVNHGVADFTTQLTEAEADVNRYLEVNWYNKSFTSGYNQVGRIAGSEFDASKLTDTQWTRVTVFRALYAHILPLLSPFQVGGDTFQEMINYYRERFHEEINMAIAQGVEYDTNGDAEITTAEKYKQRADRIYR